MNEGERCDRIALMHAGKVLTQDAPTALLRARSVQTLEEAFIASLEEATWGAGCRHQRSCLGVGAGTGGSAAAQAMAAFQPPSAVVLCPP